MCTSKWIQRVARCFVDNFKILSDSVVNWYRPHERLNAFGREWMTFWLTGAFVIKTYENKCSIGPVYTKVQVRIVCNL